MNSSISKYKPFFEAKFIIPRSKDTDVLKSNVFSLLNLFTKYKLIFIGAPAGFGKTNSLSNWIKSQNLTDNVIWISLDTDDNDPSSFFFHFIKAFDSTIKNNYTANNLKDPYEIEYSLSFILNNLNKINTKIIIILDDYHYISNELIHKGLEKFIINSKENISFIFSGRNKIPNVLSNLRFKFDLLEIDAESFLFTEDEIVGFFDKNNIKITEEQAKYIKNTNEGWILSLKTIILSILNNKKTLIPIEEISNNIKNKYIKGFLFDELLVNLDKSLVDFMMKTSILSYFNVKLCNNLLDISNASFFIEELEKKQLFFYTLDNQSNWYKYHDLFSQILSDKLKTENYSLYVDLCIKSAILFKENSDYDEAVKYAFLSNDYNFISSLLAELAPVFIGDSKILFLYELIEKIPREIIFSNTNLLSYYAFLLAIIYKIDYAKFIINEINKRDDLSENFKILNLLTNVIIYKVDNVNIKKINKSVDLILKNIHLFNKNIVPFVYYYLSRVCHFIYEINKSLILIDEAIINNNIMHPIV